MLFLCKETLCKDEQVKKMKKDFINFFEIDAEPFEVKDGYLCSSNRRFVIRDGIPRVTPDVSYSANFALLREKHAELQLDSRNGTTDRYDTILDRTQWPVEFFKGKTVLECGCGAGPDTEILLLLGCKVVSVDLAGVDVAKRNVNDNPNVQFMQASITDLPLRKKSFDIVFCHRVLQHTPYPEKTLAYILQFVKDDGAVFVHSYANTFIQRFRWKYFLLPVTRRFPPETLYKIIKWYSRPLFYFTTLTGKTKIGHAFNHFFVPFRNYRHVAKYKNKSDEFIIEYGIHNTFDALSPTYDKPIKTSAMRRIASLFLKRPFEVVGTKGMTLLRTKLE